MCFRQKVGQIITESYEVITIITFTPSHYGVNHWNLSILVPFCFVYTFTILHYPSRSNGGDYSVNSCFVKYFLKFGLEILRHFLKIKWLFMEIRRLFLTEKSLFLREKWLLIDVTWVVFGKKVMVCEGLCYDLYIVTY